MWDYLVERATSFVARAGGLDPVGLTGDDRSPMTNLIANLRHQYEWGEIPEDVLRRFESIPGWTWTRPR